MDATDVANLSRVWLEYPDGIVTPFDSAGEAEAFVAEEGLVIYRITDGTGRVVAESTNFVRARACYRRYEHCASCGAWVVNPQPRPGQNPAVCYCASCFTPREDTAASHLKNALAIIDLNPHEEGRGGSYITFTATEVRDLRGRIASAIAAIAKDGAR